MRAYFLRSRGREEEIRASGYEADRTLVGESIDYDGATTGEKRKEEEEEEEEEERREREREREREKERKEKETNHAY